MASTEPSVFRALEPHIHVADEICPLCDQPIPPDKLVQIQQRERQRAEAQAKRLREEFVNEKAMAVAEVRAELEQARKDNAIAVEQVKRESEKREVAARAEAKKEVETVMNAKLIAAKHEKTMAQEQVKAIKAEQEQAMAEAAMREVVARKETKEQVEAAMGAKLTELEQAKKTAEDLLKAVQSQQDERLQQELDKQRESLERANQKTLTQKEGEHFRERTKQLKTIEQLKRQLERRRAGELGEGAEIDLYEALYEAFRADRIKRIDKGVPGADIWHDVVENGEVCGRIVYDSKNHGGWRWSFVTKLREDQLAAEADHAVLATRVFPSGESQIHVHENGVVIANPAQVVAIVMILREHIIQMHRLRLSDHERDAKMAVLYDFINSDRCNQLFTQLDSLMKEMDDLEVTEKDAHDKTWKKRGQLTKNVQKVIQGQLRAEIDRIIKDESAS